MGTYSVFVDTTDKNGQADRRAVVFFLKSPLEVGSTKEQQALVAYSQWYISTYFSGGRIAPSSQIPSQAEEVAQMNEAMNEKIKELGVPAYNHLRIYHASNLVDLIAIEPSIFS
jgi:hypothetical protein